MFDDDDFEWDDQKSRANILKHGLGFEFAPMVFADPALNILDVSRPADEESRFKAVGLAYGQMFTVVFTWREERRRIISLRRSNAKEERIYGDHSHEA